MARTPSVIDIDLTVEGGDEPIRHRIADAILAAISGGKLAPGDELPPTRTLASALGLARGPVVAAYQELLAAGYVAAVPGGRTTVSPGADEAIAAGIRTHVRKEPTPVVNVHTPAAPVRFNLKPGYPDVSLIDTTDWRRSWRRASMDIASTLPYRHARLREALSTHLRRTRGIVAHPDEIFPVPGTASAIRTFILAADLVGKQVAFENPGYDTARLAFTETGSTIRPARVDIEGIVAKDLSAADTAAYVTPAHQFPLGGRLALSRRSELMNWAIQTGGLIIEDDYDGEFRYNVSPAPALAGMTHGRDHVAYIGTSSKILTPGMRLSWLIPPAHLVSAVSDVLLPFGDAVGAVPGLAFADFIESGALSLHLARVTRTYAARRRSFVRAIKSQLPEVNVLGIEAGLHAVLELPSNVDAEQVVRNAEKDGVMVQTLTQYSSPEVDINGLVCGYALLPERQAATAVSGLAKAIRSASRG